MCSNLDRGIKKFPSRILPTVPDDGRSGFN